MYHPNQSGSKNLTTFTFHGLCRYYRHYRQGAIAVYFLLGGWFHLLPGLSLSLSLVGIFEDITGIDAKLDAFGAFGRLVRLRQRLLPFLQLPLQTSFEIRTASMQRAFFRFFILERSALLDVCINFDVTALNGQLPYAALSILLIGRCT